MNFESLINDWAESTAATYAMEARMNVMSNEEGDPDAARVYFPSNGFGAVEWPRNYRLVFRVESHDPDDIIGVMLGSWWLSRDAVVVDPEDVRRLRANDVLVINGTGWLVLPTLTLHEFDAERAQRLDAWDSAVWSPESVRRDPDERSADETVPF